MGIRLNCWVACAIAALVVPPAGAAPKWNVDDRCEAPNYSVPAQYRAPSFQRALSYPYECRHGGYDREKVVLNFDIDSNGHPREIEVAEATNKCLGKFAQKAAKDWRYRCVGKGLTGLETLVQFTFDRPARILPLALAEGDTCVGGGELLSDVQPLVREPPVYPAMCSDTLNATENVLVEFDVTPDGRTENIRVANTTDSCFNETAALSVAAWRYSCSTAGVKAVQTTITFELAGPRPKFLGSASCSIFDLKTATVEEVIDGSSETTACKRQPEYPAHCYWSGGGKEERVVLRFDITPAGEPTNIRIEEATHDCFEMPANVALGLMEFEPSDVGFSDLGAVFDYQYSKIPKGKADHP